MFKHPQLSKSTVTQIDEKMVQPNTIDLRLEYVKEIKDADVAVLTEDDKRHRRVVNQVPDPEGFFRLEKGKSYQLEAYQEVDIAAGELGIVIGRSTLNRNGVLVVSSVYDSGFNDLIGATAYCISGPLMIKKGTRFAHLVLGEAETLEMYDGDYGKKSTKAKKGPVGNTTTSIFR